MTPTRARRGYRANRPSKRKRAELLNFYEQVFKKEDGELPPRTKAPAKQEPQRIAYTDKQNNVQEITQVVDFGDTDYFRDNTELYPQLEQATFLKETEQFDAEGRPNLVGKNLIVREAIHMQKGEYGPYYALHVIAGDPDLASDSNPNAEFSVLTKGDAVNEVIESISGIDRASGHVFDREAPLQQKKAVALRVLFAAGEGKFGGYFYCVRPAEPVEAS